MKDKRVIFMGTPTFAVPIFETLIENTNVVLAVTQPDKESGRKKELTPCPIKKIAIKHNIKVASPIKIKDNFDFIKAEEPDIIITCAYGQFLPEELIYFPKYNTINVHASLLPKLRGGAPIHHAIINGDKKTGITIMETDKGMDSGDILTQEEIKIDNDTYDTLQEKLSKLGATLLIATLPKVFNNSIKHIKQDNLLASSGFIIKANDEKINFNKKAQDVINHIRGLSSIPGAYALLENERIKIYNAVLTDNKSENPGRIVNITKDGIEVGTSTNNILLTDVCFPGKKRMLVKDLINGLNKDKILQKSFY